MSQLAYGLLTLLLIAASFCLWRQRRPLSAAARGAMTAALLVLGLAAAASLLLSLAHSQRSWNIPSAYSGWRRRTSACRYWVWPRSTLAAACNGSRQPGAASCSA